MADNEKPLSRSEYKRQQELEENDLKERDKKRLKAEREYAEQHPQSEEAITEEPRSRSRSEKRIPVSSDDKTKKMKSKLNIVIGGLVIAIIAVYLVLFFVG